VIAQTLSQNSGATSVVRITQVQSDRFTFYVHEAPDRNGAHGSETVAFLVVEAGTWQLPNGAMLRAGKLLTSKTVGKSVADQWQAVGFGGSFSTTPVVLSQVQSNNDSSWVKTRHLGVNTSSVTLGLEKDEANAANHGTETVGWLAIEPGSGSWSGLAYKAGRTSNVVKDAWYSFSFGTTLSSPRFFAAMPTRDGGDNAALRYQGLTSTGVQVRVEEDTTLDSETAHTTEVVDYLVLSGSGALTGTQQ
jgi:hypothetical protein